MLLHHFWCIPRAPEHGQNGGGRSFYRWLLAAPPILKDGANLFQPHEHFRTIGAFRQYLPQVFGHIFGREVLLQKLRDHLLHRD